MRGISTPYARQRLIVRCWWWFVGIVSVPVLIVWIAAQPAEQARSERPEAAAERQVAQGGDRELRAEIERLVIDRCIRTIVRTSPNRPEGVSTETMVTLVKIANSESYKKLYALLLPMARKLPQEQRGKIYDFGLQQCLRGARR